MRLAAYLRCSTDSQDDSLETQEQIIRDWCRTQGHEVIEFYRDFGVSAGVPVEKRPAGFELFTAVADKKRPFEGIAVLRVDRLFRDPMDELSGLVFLDEHKCPLISIKDPIDRSTPQGEFMHGAMMFVRRLERRLTGQRIKEHNLSRALTGKWPGGQPPLGLTYDLQMQTLALNDRASEAVAVFETFVASSGNASQAARALNSIGIMSRDGYPWRDDSVLTLVKSSIYRRKLKYGGRIVDAPELIPEIVSEHLLQEADRLLEIISRPFARRRPSVYAYSSLLYCSECGNRMKRITAGAYVGWICRSKKESGTCDSRTVSEKYIDRLVGQAIRSLLESISLSPADSEEAEKIPTAGKEKRLSARRKRIVETFIDGLISREERDRRLAEIDTELACLRETKQEKKLDRQTVQAIIAALETRWHNVSQETRKALLTILDARITVCTNRESLRWIELETLLPMPAIRTEARWRNKKRRRWVQR